MKINVWIVLPNFADAIGRVCLMRLKRPCAVLELSNSKIKTISVVLGDWLGATTITLGDHLAGLGTLEDARHPVK